MNTVLTAENVTKVYQIGVQQKARRSLREAIMAATTEPWHRLQRLSRWGRVSRRTLQDGAFDDMVWALRNVSFEIKSGVVLGIIGRNGSGKSTLLKVLSRIVPPTAGRVEIRGRLSSLLEVGTGFHPELSGRENIFLNGAILGMSAREVKRKFTDIVDFAEVGRFLDTPVKWYSSGMYVRLAFAVAAHLEPELVVLDEVLAVGDAFFQKKCLEKIGRLAKQGLTVVLVSHNMSAIADMCQRVIVLENGAVVFDGPTRPAIDHYLGTIPRSAGGGFQDATHWGPCRYARITSFVLLNEAGLPCDTFFMGDTLVVEMELLCTERLGVPEIGIHLQNRMGMNLQLFVSTWEGWHGPLEVGLHRFRILIPKILVYPGTYALTPWVLRPGERLDHQVDHAAVFHVLEADLTGHRPYFERYTQTNCEVYAPSIWSHTLGPEPAETAGGAGDA